MKTLAVDITFSRDYFKKHFGIYQQILIVAMDIQQVFYGRDGVLFLALLVIQLGERN